MLASFSTSGSHRIDLVTYFRSLDASKIGNYRLISSFNLPVIMTHINILHCYYWTTVLHLAQMIKTYWITDWKIEWDFLLLCGSGLFIYLLPESQYVVSFGIYKI